MDRVKKLKLNAISSIINRVVILISGMILPRLILTYYGSDVNGLTSSIKQFLGVITFLDMGVGAVVQSALFKPLAREDEDQISKIIISASNFFRKIAYILVIYVIFLGIFLPMIMGENVNYLATAFLIFAMSINRFSQFYFGIINELLLNADQKSYIQLTSEIITVIVNTIIGILLMTNGFSIIIVQLFSGLIYLIRPIYLKYYVDKNYDIDYSIDINEEPIKQKWNGLAQHIAAVILNGTDTIILTLFSTLENVSIYAVYNMVVNGVKLLITSLITGIKSFFGSLLADNEIKLLNSYFTRIEWLVHTAVVFLFGMTAVLIVPFVMIYTTGIQDANYYTPVFALLLVSAQAVYCIRIPYNSMILAAGHYKQTQNSAVIETIINIVVSVITVSLLGLVGVAIGTLVAMTYRTIYLTYYLANNIIYRSFKIFIKHIFIDILTLFFFFGTYNLLNIQITNFSEWIFYSIILGLIFLIIILIINNIFYQKTTKYYLRNIFSKR